MANNPLSADLRQLPLPLNSRLAIMKSFWGSAVTLSEYEQQSKYTDSYFRYYEEQCRAMLCDGGDGDSALIRTHADIALIVQLFKDRRHARESIEDILRQKLPQELHSGGPKVKNAIDFASRLWLMVHVGTFTRGLIPGQTAIAWKTGSLHNLIDTHFSFQQTLRAPVKLEKTFTARNIERIAGIKIIWTDNLADHLRMRDDDTRVALFHHVSLLEYHRNCDIFPKPFLDETLRTISLLLPQFQKDSSRWYESKQREHCLDPRATRCGQLSTEDRQIENFRYWRDRLIILKQAFDGAEPKTIKQWYHDSRRRVQWYTFWMAAIVLGLTLVFGLVQTIEGGLQAYKAFYP